eukprot:CAMPEP_0174902450 /NCGR_PEP_ID=MMETSP0167-20121228/37844_1 /TAXON_ID=38298 /ORGANISM="Rhodella maculata, Strain CCMP736" /LENGTH=213 /DNA_ID=CAMNT_0016144461 /DNA_START=63 /DNA_END=703 /DNA_ORIENTATION=-
MKGIQGPPNPSALPNFHQKARYRNREHQRVKPPLSSPPLPIHKLHRLFQIPPDRPKILLAHPQIPIIPAIPILARARVPNALLSRLVRSESVELLTDRNREKEVVQARAAATGVHIVGEAEGHKLDERGGGREEHCVDEVGAVDSDRDPGGPHGLDLGGEGLEGGEVDRGKIERVPLREAGKEILKLDFRLLRKPSTDLPRQIHHLSLKLIHR